MGEWGRSWRGGGGAAIIRREGACYTWGGGEGEKKLRGMGERMGDTSRASNILPPSLLRISFFFFLPHLHFSPVLPPPSTFYLPFSIFYYFSSPASPPALSPSLPRSLAPSLFSKSLKGGHEGDNANTDPLNREWEEDSCWR